MAGRVAGNVAFITGAARGQPRKYTLMPRVASESRGCSRTNCRHVTGICLGLS